MEVLYFSNEFPKEDLQDSLRSLHRLSRARSHPLLSRFLREATRAVKDEITLLPSSLKHLFGPFETLFAWAEDTELREGLLCGAVDGVLLVLLQLAVYISHAERNANINAQIKADIHLAALGVGLLSATAVATAQDNASLPLTGADAVRIAFRMGIHVQMVSSQLESRDMDAPGPWAYVVHNLEPSKAQENLDVFHAAAPTPEGAKVFISAMNRTSVTVSGPPLRLKNLFQKSKLFRDAISIALPVYGGLCHAPHVYGAADTSAIVHNTEGDHVQSDSRSPLVLYSTSTGKPYNASNALTLQENAVTELLTCPIQWERVVSAIVESAQRTQPANIVLQCFGNSIPLHELETALRVATKDVQISVESLMSALTDHTSSETEPRGTAQSKLAIVGMSCRLPGGATDLDKFWQVLESGLDVSRQIPSDRFDIATHYDPTGKDTNKTMTQYGCFIDEPGLFDAAFFNMSPREAAMVDPQMRLSLVTAYEALEMSGFVANRTQSTKLQRIGTYYGQAADDYREVNQGQEVSTYYIPGGCRAFGPGRINYFFKFAGPSYSIDTACSSGLAAIEVACQALWNGEVDMAVAGGVNILTNPDGFTGLGKGHFLTKTHNACKTWDAGADGYCRADGVGSLVIKRLQDAQADNDNILGVVLATGTNHSAEAVSITHPHAGHQSYLARQLLRQAGVNPLDVSYIEMHGTGTQAGDFEEMSGVLDVYAPTSSHRRRSEQSLHVGSVKSNVGHGESVAGTTALIKVLMMMQKNEIPRHIGIKTELNPRFPDLEKRNVHIPFSNTAWPRTHKKRIAAVNNFGAAGGNTMMLLEDAPTVEPGPQDPRPSHTVAVSGKTRTALSNNIERLISYLDDHIGETDLAHLGYTTTARKYHHSYRIAVTATDIAGVRRQLLSSLDQVQSIKPIGNKSNTPSVAFAFTGQGASHHSMGLELYRDVSVFRQHIDNLDAIAQRQGFPSFIPALDGSHPQEYEHPPVVTQLALVCTEIALAQYWTSLEVCPDIVVGHSLGEYAAMQVAGVISASDAIFMVGRRAELLQERCTAGSHCMMAVRASVSTIADVLSGSTTQYSVACINSPSDTVLSGTKAQVDEIAPILEAAGHRCIILGVAFAFHSEQTDPILDDFETICKNVIFQEPKLPVISPLHAKVVFDGRTLNAEYVRRATRETVDFASAIETAHEVSAVGDDTIWIEIGPHPVCTGFVKSILPEPHLALPSFRRGQDNWKSMSETLAALHVAGIDLDWNEFHSPFGSGLRLLNLPTYAWDEKNYWLQYNGDWCLTKGNGYYQNSSSMTTGNQAISTYESLSSLVQKIVSVEIDGANGVVVMQSNLMQKDFLAAAHGHRMNDCGVVTSSIHADIGFTLGDYLNQKFYPGSKRPDMNMTNLVVTKGLVAHKGSTSISQLIQVTARTADIDSGILDLTWQNIDSSDGTPSEPFATANIEYGSSGHWLTSWTPMTHLIQHRIETLDAMAAAGSASRLSGNMAYTLWAHKLVDYAEKYRGMQTVVMSQLEAYANIRLSDKDDGGQFMVPPYFIDSVAHLAGFVMNCSDAIDTHNNYCVTSGWQSMRFAEPLVAGGRYQSYVKMIPTEGNSAVFLGDIYILRADDSKMIGMVGGITFRRFPRLLLGHFFTAPEPSQSVKEASTPALTWDRHSGQRTPAETHTSTESSGGSSDHDSGFEESELLKIKTVPKSQKKPNKTKETPSSVAKIVVATNPAEAPSTNPSMADKALLLVARETALELDDLQDQAEFSNLGIDSLMSLVLAEKFRTELDVKVNGSLFLDYPTIGDLRNWLDDYYS